MKSLNFIYEKNQDPQFYYLTKGYTFNQGHGEKLTSVS